MNSENYIGKEFDCKIGNEIKKCKIVDVCKKNRYWVVVEGRNGNILLRSEKINLGNDEKWMKANKPTDKPWEILLEEYHKSLDERYSHTNKNEKSHQAALDKNERLSEILHDKRETMCGVGTRRVKLMLNKLVKQGDRIAELYRKAIEVEDCNIRAKESSFYYKGKIYRQKSRLLLELVDLCLKSDVVVGKQMVEGRETNCILYFELPNVEQISFHTTLEEKESFLIPDYPKQWDGKTCSTLNKLEDALNKMYYNK